MAKYRYFETLEKLADYAEEAVRLGCSAESSRQKRSFTELRRACDGCLCELEDALFSDFLPPLERDSIAACAHCLCRVTDEASELRERPAAAHSNEEAAVCVKLSAALRESVGKLRRITRPDEFPDTQGYRRLLSEGRQAHGRMLDRLRQGELPRSAASSIIQTGRLRAELSRAFDEVVEVMLNNI